MVDIRYVGMRTILAKMRQMVNLIFENRRSLFDVNQNYYENMPIQIYWKFYHQKNENFQMKNSDIFHISAQNIYCGYSLEPPRRGGSNGTHNLCFEQK